LRGRNRKTERRRGRSAGAAHWHPLRARFPQVLQEVRRALRRLRGQTDLSGIRRRRRRPSRSADRGISGAPRTIVRSPQPEARGGACSTVIDLHTHTTASDGRCTPEELVDRAAAAGVRVLAVTDHDTIAGCRAASEACAGAKITFVPGIEVTAVADGADIHVLGYFVQTNSAGLLSFLAEQRLRRVNRIREMIGRLASHDIVLDADAILAPAVTDSSKSVGRPWIARALVSGGHVPNVAEAFNRWLSRGRPAFVPRVGATPEEVFERIHQAGGIASLAHP